MIKLKHILPIFASVALVSCGMFKSSEPEKFIGTITYKMQYAAPEGEENPMLEAMSSMFPSELIQGTDGVNFGMKMNGGQAMHLVANVAEKMYYISTQGQFIKQAFPEPDTTASTENITIEELTEEKEFLGLTCQGYKITNGETVTTVYVTSKFVLDQPQDMLIGAAPEAMAQIVGTPLYTHSTVNQGGQNVVITLEATAINEGAEAAKEIVTPAEGEYMEM